MKIKLVYSIVLASVLFSCNNSQEAVEDIESKDITIVEDNTNEEESTPVKFMGTDKDSHELYGHTDFDKTTAVSLDTMFAFFSRNAKFSGAVNMTINEVCQNAGCWINFQKPNSEETVMVFFRDHFTIPIEASLGKEAILFGQLVSDTLSIDFQKHLLDDAAENGTEVAQSEYDAITEDKIDVSFDCESILISK